MLSLLQVELYASAASNILSSEVGGAADSVIYMSATWTSSITQEEASSTSTLYLLRQVIVSGRFMPSASKRLVKLSYRR